MKKSLKILKIFTILALSAAFGFLGCKSDSEDENEHYAVESISISGFSDAISMNNEYSVTPAFTPANASNKGFTISVTSEDGKEIDWVEVDNENGTIKATGEGKFKLIVTSNENPSIKDEKTVESKASALTGISLTSSEKFYVGRTTTLTPTFIPETASYKNVKWSSSDENVATVNELGEVKGIKEGTATITVTSEKYPTISAQIEITVEEAPLVTLKIQEDGDGFVSSTFSKSTDFPGYTGTGYLDGGTPESGNIVYTVSATEDITNAKIAIHYLATEVTRVRAALVSVNGTVINAAKPLAMTTDVKVKKDNCTSANWKDTAFLENVSLKKGSNSIMVTGAPDGKYTAAGGETITISGQKEYLNYVDYLIVVGKGIDYGTDTTKYVSFSYASENKTAGSVESTATTGSIAENTEVTLTANPNSGWTFECWSDGTKTNPYTFKISKATYLFAHFIPENYTAPTDLVGYATVTSDAGNGYTITGGAGAIATNTVTIASYSELVAKKDLLSSDEPKIITISGTISTKDNTNPLLSEKYDIGSNTTIYGDMTNQGRLQNIEFIVEGENVIIRNMMFGEVISWDKPEKSGADDALSLNGATHVWVDHCEFQSHLTPQDLDGNAITSSSPYYSTDEKWAKDFYDGLLDIKNGSTWITISNCYFHDHWKACLCASGDGAANKNTTTGATDDDMRITFYNNYWKDINARQPLFRWGKAHIFNSYFYSAASEMSGQSTGINCRAGSHVYIDNNTFENIKTPIGYYNDESASKTGYWVDKDNTFTNCKNSPDSSSTAYEPPYKWTPKTASEAKTYVQSNAGVGKLSASDLQ